MWILLRTDQIYPYVFVYSLKIPYQISTSSQSFKTTSQHHFSLFCHSSTLCQKTKGVTNAVFSKVTTCLREQILRKKKYQPKTHPSIHPSIAFCLSDSGLLGGRRLASCPSYYKVTTPLPPKNVNILVQQWYFSSFPLNLLWIFQFTSWIIIRVRISTLCLNNAH